MTAQAIKSKFPRTGAEFREMIATTSQANKAKLARNGAEFRELVASDADWIIRSADDLRKRRESPENPNDPLVKLPEPDFVAFVDSLIFNDGGVVSGSYRHLMHTLSLSEILEVMEGFGMSRSYFMEETLEQCCKGADCVWEMWKFCSSLTCPGTTNCS